MENIEWKPIKDYEGLYMVSNTGLVKSLHWGKEEQKQVEVIYGIIFRRKESNRKCKRYV